MTKGEEISEEAKAAKTSGDLWSLFFTEDMLDKIVQFTNDKISETIEKSRYSTEHLSKNTYIQHIDKVGSLHGKLSFVVNFGQHHYFKNMMPI
jgi:hypothetical protein